MYFIKIERYEHVHSVFFTVHETNEIIQILMGRLQMARQQF